MSGQDRYKLDEPLGQGPRYLVDMLFQHNDASVVNIGADWLPILNEKQLHRRQQTLIMGFDMSLQA